MRVYARIGMTILLQLKPGHVIVDDYDDPAWPAVTAVVNEVLVSHLPIGELQVYWIQL